MNESIRSALWVLAAMVVISGCNVEVPTSQRDAQSAADTPDVRDPGPWNDNASPTRTRVGSCFAKSCTADGVRYRVYGTDVYADSSSICTAAVHAGAITLSDGGSVAYQVLPGQASYPGSTRNGVTSSTRSTSWIGSFRILGALAAGESPTCPPLGSLPWDAGVDGGVDGGVDAGPTCVTNGQRCGAHSDCCTNYCDIRSGTCVCHPTDHPFAPPGRDVPIRTGPGACRRHSDCCSGNCSGGECLRPNDCHGGCLARAGLCGTANCVGLCATCATRTSCSADGSCCAGGCEPGWRCGLDACGNPGQCGACSANTHCENHQCVPDCLPSCDGQSCGTSCAGLSCGTCRAGYSCGRLTSSGPMVCIGATCIADGFECSSTPCCSGVCTGGLCGAAACRAELSPCDANAQCCSGRCSSGACTRPSSSTCRSAGEACAGASDCCSGTCSANRCGAATGCASANSPCSSPSECCSSNCTFGRCAAGGSTGDCVSLNACIRATATRGTVCGDARSLEVRLTNTCGQHAFVKLCLQDGTGACRMVDVGLDAGAGGSYHTCVSTGGYCLQATTDGSPASCRAFTSC